MADRILGMGDIVSLVERAQEQYDEEEAKRLQKKIAKNQFDFNDFLSQIAQIKKMGNLKDLASMIPGVGKAIKDIDIDDNAFKSIEAIIYSMTPAERSNPEILNGSRRTRIAKGSGTTIQEVNRLLKQFDQTRKMMKMVTSSKMQGHWIIEMSEMIATANAKSIEEIKSFLSRQKETYKIPYETHPADRKRQCVFGGSSNTLDFLPLDRTGNRRFVPVMVYPERAEVHILADEQASREYINQMWAEAMEIYRSGNFRLRFSPAMNDYLKAHQKDFMPEDTKAGQILDYLERYSGSIVCSKQLYKEALGHDYDEPKQWELREINDIMNNAVTGWRAFSNPRYFPEPYRRQKGWERIRNDNEPDNSMDGFQEIPTEEMEQLGLPEEWLKQK